MEDARAAGSDLPVEELCRDRPDLIEIVRAKIAALHASDWMQPDRLAATGSRVLAGRYRLEHLVGQGGYGQVWRAFDQELHRPVAVKVPQATRRLGERQIDQLLTEARKVARLRHPGIVAVHDVQKEGAAYFLVSDYIEGEDLAERLRRGPLPVAGAVRIAVQVAHVLAYAHNQGVVHRDIKPSNVLLGQDGSVHVCDFGIAVTQAELASGGDRRATLAYASPEQLGGAVDHRTDIWSLGVMLCEMLTGRRPFDADDPVRLQRQILAAEPPAMPGVPEPVAVVCPRCLAKKPEERFASGNDVATALEAARGSRPRRWPVLLGVVGLLAVTVFALRFSLPTRPTPEPIVAPPKEVGEVNVDPPNDRADAEWVQSRGGRVRLRLPDGRADLVVATLESLPAGSWGLDGVILEGAKLDEAMIARIARMRSLRTLHLGGSNVTIAHLIVLKQGLRLRTLGVNWVGLTDDQLEVIADFSGLEELDMSGAKVTAAGVRHLRRAKALRDVAINGVSLTPEVVAELGQLTQLRKIYLQADEVVARRELNCLLPECQLIPPSKPPILPARVLEGHTTIRTVQFRPDGDWLASADERTLRLWPPAGEAVTLDMPSPPTSMVFGPNGLTVFTGHDDGVVRHWWVGARTPREQAAAWVSWGMSPNWTRFTLLPFAPWSGSPSLIRSWPGDGSPVQAVATAPSGKWAAWTTRNKLYIWDAVGNRMATPLNKPDMTTVSLFFLPDAGFAPDELLMAGWHNGPQRKADLLQWKPLPLADGLGLSPRGRMQNFGLMKGVQHVTADPDFKLIVATLDGGLAAFAKAADAPGFHLVGQLGHTMPGTRRTAILPDAARTLSYGEDCTLCLWEPKSQMQRIISDPHPMPVTDVAVSPDGKLAATGCRDGKVRLWLLADDK